MIFNFTRILFVRVKFFVDFINTANFYNNFFTDIAIFSEV